MLQYSCEYPDPVYQLSQPVRLTRVTQDDYDANGCLMPSQY